MTKFLRRLVHMNNQEMGPLRFIQAKKLILEVGMAYAEGYQLHQRELEEWHNLKNKVAVYTLQEYLQNEEMRETEFVPTVAVA